MPNPSRLTRSSISSPESERAANLGSDSMPTYTRTNENIQKALETFQMRDWTLESTRTNGGIHSIHPYPAKFVPQLPRHLLELFHPVSPGPVLDPFCGSGTTLVECQSRNIPSYGIDLNPIATLISRVKTNPPSQLLSDHAIGLINNATSTTQITIPDIPRLNHWFTTPATNALSKLTSAIIKVNDRTLRDALQLTLSRIIVRVSRQESDTRYAATNRFTSEDDVYRLFIESANILDKTFNHWVKELKYRARAHVITKDILSATPSDFPERFGLIITSPPYPNAYEYWLYHKYRMYWLGKNPLEVRDFEIGARPHYHKKNPATPADFRDQMSKCFCLFREITLPQSIVCFIIGRSIIRGEHVDNAALLCDAAAQYGYQHVATATRSIPRTRKSFNPTHGNIESESILIFLGRAS